VYFKKKKKKRCCILSLREMINLLQIKGIHQVLLESLTKSKDQ